jgi:Amino acid synthesis
VKKALALLTRPAIAYGKGAIVGTLGDIEHAAAILHPRMGKPMRDAIGGGQAIIPSNVKIGGVGAVIVALADGGRPRPRCQVRRRAAARSELTGEFDWIESKPGLSRPTPVILLVACCRGRPDKRDNDALGSI